MLRAIRGRPGAHADRETFLEPIRRPWSVAPIWRERVETLDLDKYVCPLGPGRYRVTVLYHNSFSIGFRGDASYAIVVSSEPFVLIVKPAVAAPRPASQPR